MGERSIKNYKALTKEIEKTQMEKYPVFMNWNNFVKMSILIKKSTDSMQSPLKYQ